MREMKLSPHFDSDEFKCKCGCGLSDIDAKLIVRLEKLRKLCGDKPLRVNSGHRCKEHNTSVGGSPNSQHLLGKAADIRCPAGMTIDQFADKAKRCDFGGLGIYKTFLHLDVRNGRALWDNR